jgi:hypothetical protein
MRKIFLMLLLLCFSAWTQAQITAILRYRYACSDLPIDQWYSTRIIPCTPSCEGDQTTIFQVVFEVPPPGGTIGSNPYRMKVTLFDAGMNIIGTNQIRYSTPLFSPTFNVASVIPGPIIAKITLEKRTIRGWKHVNTYWTNTLIKEACCPVDILITGTYTTPLTEALRQISTVSTTIIPANSIVKLDANLRPFNIGFITLNPGFETQPGSVFIAQALDGCDPGVPMRATPVSTNETAVKPVPLPVAPASGLIVYPNPATGIIHIQHPVGTKQLLLYNMAGKLIINANARINGKTEMDISALPAGSYFLSADGRLHQKIVKQ